ncbi:hypothetical protein O9G_000905 [Rozella allomycis CSF55]|uniref:Uncharacterized protein n=1 Tax=Rozella allomycis (strain CSF55) TaxID=988480 RepID=A0A075AN73_ROZAC|nr:hypothetical protein O9G_000905 [Rozella allomycis CSF55]|eukprot:EPZ31260.1 hypothetical protein O9G_000905 [Rozella allomycis CSF55]
MQTTVAVYSFTSESLLEKVGDKVLCSQMKINPSIVNYKGTITKIINDLLQIVEIDDDVVCFLHASSKKYDLCVNQELEIYNVHVFYEETGVFYNYSTFIVACAYSYIEGVEKHEQDKILKIMSNCTWKQISVIHSQFEIIKIQFPRLNALNFIPWLVQELQISKARNFISEFVEKHIKCFDCPSFDEDAKMLTGWKTIKEIKEKAYEGFNGKRCGFGYKNNISGEILEWKENFKCKINRIVGVLSNENGQMVILDSTGSIPIHVEQVDVVEFIGHLVIIDECELFHSLISTFEYQMLQSWISVENIFTKIAKISLQNFNESNFPKGVGILFEINQENFTFFILKFQTFPTARWIHLNVKEPSIFLSAAKIGMIFEFYCDLTEAILLDENDKPCKMDPFRIINASLCFARFVKSNLDFENFDLLNTFWTRVKNSYFHVYPLLLELSNENSKVSVQSIDFDFGKGYYYAVPKVVGVLSSYSLRSCGLNSDLWLRLELFDFFDKKNSVSLFYKLKDNKVPIGLEKAKGKDYFVVCSDLYGKYEYSIPVLYSTKSSRLEFFKSPKSLIKDCPFLSIIKFNLSRSIPSLVLETSVERNLNELDFSYLGISKSSFSLQSFCGSVTKIYEIHFEMSTGILKSSMNFHFQDGTWECRCKTDLINVIFQILTFDLSTSLADAIKESLFKTLSSLNSWTFIPNHKLEYIQENIIEKFFQNRKYDVQTLLQMLVNHIHSHPGMFIISGYLSVNDKDKPFVKEIQTQQTSIRVLKRSIPKLKVINASLFKPTIDFIQNKLDAFD